MLEQIRDRALTLDVPVVAAAAEHAILRVRDALDLDQRQRSLRTTRFPPEAREIDVLVDAAITGLDAYCESQMALFRGQERAAAAARLKRALLPDGVASITHLPFADQHKQIETLLARAQAPEVVTDLGILPDAAVALVRVREVNGQYGAVLRQAEDTLTRQDVRARHAECQELLCTTACLIIGHFAAFPEREADRDHLLEPILREEEALRERRRRRRAASTNEYGTDDIIPAPDDESDQTAPAP